MLITIDFAEDVRVFCGLSLTANCCGLRYMSNCNTGELIKDLYYRYCVIDQKKFAYMVLKHCIVFNTINLPDKIWIANYNTSSQNVFINAGFVKDEPKNLSDEPNDQGHDWVKR